MLPLLEEDSRTSHDSCGKQDIVDRCDHRCIEDVQGLVQVVNLDTDADHQANQEYPAQWFFQDLLPSKQLFQCDAQALDTGH